MSKRASRKSGPQAVANLIESGLDAKKCRRCGKMAGVIEKAARVFAGSDDAEMRGMAAKFGELRGRTLKQASSDFGCGGCWGSKASKELSKSFKVVKAKKSTKTTGQPEIVDAADSRPMGRDERGTFAVELGDGSIRCMHYTPRGGLTHVVTGREAAAIVAVVADAGLTKRVETAAYLGWELARAQAALTSGEPYVANPWPVREKKGK
jgi:hypothetical protein